jgi:ATP-dependent RNA helicase SUPV3L1/SUV3
VERLAGIIRAAIVDGPAGLPAGRASPRKSNGFVVTGQMTSLTGCSTEQFASILRSMGFRSVEMSRSEFFGSLSASEPTDEREPLAPMENPELAAHDQATPIAACENGTSADDLALVSTVISPAEGAPQDIAPPDMPANASCSDASGAVAGVESVSPGIPLTSREAARKDDPIVVWRPDRTVLPRRGAGRKMKSNRAGPPLSEHLRTGAAGRSDDVNWSPAPPPEPTRDRNRSGPSSTKASADARKAAERSPSRADQSGNVRPHEKHRQTAINRDMSLAHPGPGQQPRAKVDPDSPFAKLLELRSLLEEQANKRP